LAVLAKGLVGLVLPLIVIGPYLLLTRQLKAVLRPGLLLTGALVFGATAATWYWPVISRHGADFINEFFLSHHLQRYVSNKFRHPQPSISSGSSPSPAYFPGRYISYRVPGNR